jgi:hypothetical protein
VNLLMAELWRFWSRRVVKVTALVAIALITVVMTITYTKSTYDRSSGYSVVSEDCGTIVTDFEGEPDRSSCEEFQTFADDNRLRLVDLGDVLGGTGPLFVFVAILLAASCLGAEFGAASLSTQLLFEPRRTRVWTAKAAALAFGIAAITLALVGLLILEYLAVCLARGITDGTDSSFAFDRALDVARLVGASALGGLFGFAITGLARRTVAALGVFILLFIAEPLVYNATDLFDGKLPLWSLFAFVNNPFDEPAFDPADTFGLHSLSQAGLVPALWIAAMLVFTGWQFHRSEIR